MHRRKIRNELRRVASRECEPAAGLRQLGAIARAWTAKLDEAHDRGKYGASMAPALSDRRRKCAVRGSLAKERLYFLNHFGLRD